MLDILKSMCLSKEVSSEFANSLNPISMNLKIRSPYGGNKLAGLWTNLRTAANILVRPTKRPQAVGDYVCYKIGYANNDIQKGDPILIPRSDLEHLKNIW